MKRSKDQKKLFVYLGLLLMGVTTLHSLVVSVPGEKAQALVPPECLDGVDNDRDGLTDFPEDLECNEPHDTSESAYFRNLFITVTDGMNEVETGESLIYQIALRTNGDRQRTVDVRFFLPEFVNMMSASEAGRREGNVVIWRDVVIYPQYVKNLTVTIEVQPSTPARTLLLAEARADGERATDTTLVIEEEQQGLAPLEVFVDDGKVYAEPGEELTYVITVKNAFARARTFDLITQLPPQLKFLGATGEYKRNHRSVEWHDQFIEYGEVIVYELTGYVERDAPEFTTIRLRVSSDAALGSDTTTVLYEQIPPAALDISVNDKQDLVKPGEVLTYTIDIKNNRGKLLTGVDVKNAHPVYTEFVSATEGGYWTGKDILWEDLTISPYGRRTLQVTLRVRSDAPLGADLRNRVHVVGHEAQDSTLVSNVNRGNSTMNNPETQSLLQKFADKTEVRPGDTVTYTIVVRNTLDHAVRNVVVEDRMDTQHMSVLNAEEGQMLGDKITWHIPELAPNQEWSVRYTARVQDYTPHGVQIANVATVSGEGMQSVSLTHTTSTMSIGVVTELPRSGAPLDAIFAGISLVFGSFPTLWIRKRSSVLA